MKIKLFFHCLLFFNINLLRSSEKAAKAAKAATAQRTIASENLTTTRLIDPRPGSFDQKLQQARDTEVELQQKSFKSNMQKELLERSEAFGGVMQKKRLPIGKPLDTTVEIKQFFLKRDMQQELRAKSMQKDLKRDMQKELLAKSMQKELLAKSAANSGTMQKRLPRVQSFKPIPKPAPILKPASVR